MAGLASRALQFAYLNLRGHPRGEHMLASLLARGLVPRMVVEEDSSLAAKAGPKLRARLRQAGPGYPLPVSTASMAAAHGLAVHRVPNHNSLECEQLLRESGCELVVLGDCRIIQPQIMAVPRLGVVNVHPGYLPAVKGNNPYVWSILNDLPQGCSVHFIDEQIDQGPIILKAELDCPWGVPGFGYPQLLAHVNLLCGSLLAESMERITDGTFKLEEQPPCDPNHTFKSCPEPLLNEAIAKLERGWVPPSARAFESARSTSTVSVPLMITKKMRHQLATEGGLSASQIHKLTPAEAHAILAKT